MISVYNKIYLAGPWFTNEGMETMREVMRIVGSVNDKINDKVYFPLANQGGSPCEVFNKDVEAIKNADIIIAIVNEKDCGTAFELGLAFALKKHVILMATSEEAFHKRTNLMLAFAANSCMLLDQFAEYLQGLPVTKVNIENIWEGKGYSS